jgi:hypothetical protein
VEAQEYAHMVEGSQPVKIAEVPVSANIIDEKHNAKTVAELQSVRTDA